MYNGPNQDIFKSVCTKYDKKSINYWNFRCIILSVSHGCLFVMPSHHNTSLNYIFWYLLRLRRYIHDFIVIKSPPDIVITTVNKSTNIKINPNNIPWYDQKSKSKCNPKHNTNTDFDHTIPFYSKFKTKSLSPQNKALAIIIRTEYN